MGSCVSTMYDDFLPLLQLAMPLLFPVEELHLSVESTGSPSSTTVDQDVPSPKRREQMLGMQSFLHVSTVLAESYNFLKELQDYELEKCKELMKSISETQLKVLKKISFIAKLRRHLMLPGCSSD
ncbi:hypothetical protein Tco_0577028 [Tanacetum coccineum]